MACAILARLQARGSELIRRAEIPDETPLTVELIRGLHNIRPQHRNCVLTIGAFDGVHRGHRAVLTHVVERARQSGLPSVVTTLEPLPREYFAPIRAPARLTSFREKFEQLRTLNIDRVLLIHFDQRVQQMEAEPFIVDVFVRQLGLQHIVVGDDLRFGQDGRGDFALLQRLGKEHGFGVENTATLELGDSRVSSTRIRELLERGDFGQAGELLGRRYSMSGKVVYGQQLGSRLGVPTANIRLNRLRAAMSGVYAVKVRIEGEAALIPGVANVGTRPTINELIEAILEVHLLNFHENIYGRHVEVIFYSKLREEKKFAGVDELVGQIRQDIARAQTFFKTPG